MSSTTNEPFIVFGALRIEQAEIDEVVATLESGWLGTGPRVARFEADFAAYKGTDASHVAAVNSCTTGLTPVIADIGTEQMIRRDWCIPDELWARIQPLLRPRPAHSLGCHDPQRDDVQSGQTRVGFGGLGIEATILQRSAARPITENRLIEEHLGLGPVAVMVVVVAVPVRAVVPAAGFDDERATSLSSFLVPRRSRID